MHYSGVGITVGGHGHHTSWHICGHVLIVANYLCHKLTNATQNYMKMYPSQGIYNCHYMLAGLY